MNQAKAAIKSSTLLVQSTSDTPASVKIDASGLGVGITLEQLVKGVWASLSFFSKKLRDTELHYSTLGQALLAGYLAVKNFYYFLKAASLLSSRIISSSHI